VYDQVNPTNLVSAKARALQDYYLYKIYRYGLYSIASDLSQ